nr:hypothetical protein [Armatimonadota bacterium]
VQMHIAYSGTFHGAAIYAGGPDDCAQGSVLTAVTTCLGNAPPVDVHALTSTVRNWEKQGLIDPLTNLAGQPVYLWSGLLDAVVRQPLMNALSVQYRALGADVFRFDDHFPAAHGWESPYGPASCGEQKTPYMISCAQGSENHKAATQINAPPYDSEQVWLSRWLGTLHPKNDGALNGSVLPFDQRAFSPGEDAARISLDKTGYVYVPKECAAGAVCGLMMALHGCNQSHSVVGMSFILDAGIDQWADTNRLIVLYPQTIASSLTGGNPQGCWNWWGYLGDQNYATRNGAQMKALYRMVLQAESRPRRTKRDP